MKNDGEFRQLGGYDEEHSTDIRAHPKFAIPTISPDMDGEERTCSTPLLSQADRRGAE